MIEHICDVCKRSFTVDKANSKKYECEGKQITLIYIECLNCNIKYSIAFHNGKTIELRETIKNCDDEIKVNELKEEYKNIINKNERCLKKHNKYIEDESMYYNYYKKFVIKK
jgi:hypothetical protein